MASKLAPEPETTNRRSRRKNAGNVDPEKAYAINSIFDMVRQRFAGMLGVSFRGERDLYEVLGYQKLLRIGDFVNLYQRNGIASRIVRAFPQATWRDPITIRDQDGDGIEKSSDNYSPFAEGVHNLINAFNVKATLERLDRLSGVGQYGVLYMGFADGADPQTPLSPGPHKLAYLTPFGETNVAINNWDLDTKSARFGKPKLYTLRTGQITGGTGQQSSMRSFPAHWSRCIHVSEFLDDDEVFGTPRLMPVYNHLKDLEKLLGSSAETFWLNARGGLSLEADPKFAMSPETLSDMKEQAEEFGNQLRRTLALQGVAAKQLNAQVADPKANYDALMDTISGAVGMPRRILTGSERGELASSQDENNWAARINERQRNFATPFILTPFINIMAATGNVPTPNGEWRAEWPDATAMSALNVAQIGERKANALRLYSTSAGAEDVVPMEEFRTDFLGLPPESEYLTPDEEPIDEADPDSADQFAQTAAGVQVTAMNGAQIAALTAIVEAVGAKTLDPDSAVQLIMISFPTVDETTARAMVKPMIEVEPPPKPVPPMMIAGPTTPVAKEGGGEGGGEGGTAADGERGKATASANRLARVLEVYRRKGQANSAPRTLYVRRDVLNADAIRSHFASQGLATMVPAEEMHVTIAYSTAPVDWMKITNDWTSDAKGNRTVSPGGARQMDLFGPNKEALVLLFNSSELAWRWQEIINAGASWGQTGDYQPHITITYNLGTFKNNAERDARVAAIQPYIGAIELGPEIFQEIVSNWSDSLTENRRG